MTNTIPNVPRELKPCPFCGDIPSENSHALTDGGFKYGAIQCGCGALGPDVRTEYKDWPHWRDAAFAAWNERALLSAPSPAGVDGLEVVGWYRMDGRKDITPYPSVCATWHKMGVKVGAAYSDSAHVIIDGLRYEIDRLIRESSKANPNYHLKLQIECDWSAKRIGELEGLLRSCLPALSDGGCAALANRIAATLSAGKEGE